ncbi:MAG TPA: DUF456 family protein [Thermoanaerobaculia bacterium]|nr:DUF456 family protein [Thermoanaerobaculia bacterium]
MTGLLWILAVVCIVAGVAGTVLPALPGAPLVFVGLLLAAWADGFQKVGWFPLILVGLLTLATLAVDLLATSLGAKRVGASWLALAGAAVGTVVGIFLGLPGLILGPFVGAFAGEYLARRNWRQAGKVGFGTWLGLVLGTAAKIALVFTMLGIFLTAYVI